MIRQLIRQWIRSLILIGLVMTILPWLFYGPMALYGITFPSQREQSLQLLLAGGLFSAVIAMSFVLLRSER